jgi:nephrocystin-3
MAAIWRTVRVFISSTFRDMQAERDWLVKRVFPALRQHLEPQRIHLVDIDLRWGITRQQADNDQVLGLCLQQIDECRPFFLGLLGGRYGWVPSKFPVEVGARYGWTQHYTGKSVTELEILHGVLNDPAMHGRALFCFRAERFLDAVTEKIHLHIYI